MKKNNKFRNNGNSNAYSLNYKFDSVSPAGKYNGTALDLIKRYNELAKEAHSSGNYIEMEVFRQYAEHYRKIVTEINERKNMRQENQNASHATNYAESATAETTPETDNAPEKIYRDDAKQNVTDITSTNQPPQIKKSFKIVEIQESSEAIKSTENARQAEKTESSAHQESQKTASSKPRRQIRRKTETNSNNEEKTEAAV